MTSAPSLLKTSSKRAVNFDSRSRSRNWPSGHRPGASRPGCKPAAPPLWARVVGATDEVIATAAHLNEEEDGEPGRPDRVHGEEVGCQDLLGVLADEVAPGPLAAARFRLRARLAPARNSRRQLKGRAWPAWRTSLGPPTPPGSSPVIRPGRSPALCLVVNRRQPGSAAKGCFGRRRFQSRCGLDRRCGCSRHRQQRSGRLCH